MLTVFSFLYSTDTNGRRDVLRAIERCAYFDAVAMTLDERADAFINYFEMTHSRMAASSRPHRHATPLLSVYSAPVSEPTITHATHSRENSAK